MLNKAYLSKVIDFKMAVEISQWKIPDICKYDSEFK